MFVCPALLCRPGILGAKVELGSGPAAGLGFRLILGEYLDRFVLSEGRSQKRILRFILLSRQRKLVGS